MNIFYLHKDPKTCAEMHCDKHVVKMILEYAQLLSTAHRVLDGDEWADRVGLYKATHKNHPSAVWARESAGNYFWLNKLFQELCKEYTKRYDKIHGSQIRLGDYLYVLPSSLNTGFQGIETGLTEPPQCMPDYCKAEGDAVMGYRNYYIREKSYMARWNFTPEPIWYTIGMAAEVAKVA
jgi:hypothetical protein